MKRQVLRLAALLQAMQRVIHSKGAGTAHQGCDFPIIEKPRWAPAASSESSKNPTTDSGARARSRRGFAGKFLIKVVSYLGT
jgi:hypothetical protein